MKTIVGELRQNPVDHAVLHEAEAVVPHVKTLDAIHLGSDLLRGLDDFVICTHDRAMKHVAGLLGLEVHDPVTDDPAST